MEYRLIRSDRKTLAIEVRPDGVLVRAPIRATRAQIDAFVASRARWIAAAREKLRACAPAQGARLTPEDIRALADEAARVIPQRVAFYAPKVGVSYGRITIRNQLTRWGSCSARGNLNFNCLLMLAPPEVLDSVVVHELCHRKEMNHSKAFYAEVLRVFPDYWKCDQWLKTEGAALMRRQNDPSSPG